jgi:hypothetical protein
VIAGRSEARLRELAERFGGLEWQRADAVRRNSVFDLVERGDVFLSTVGPFAKWGDAAVRAAIAAGAVYLDSTGEPAFIRRVFEELGPAAERAGATRPDAYFERFRLAGLDLAGLEARLGGGEAGVGTLPDGDATYDVAYRTVEGWAVVAAERRR